jgi:MATE family multidrug resistance protein
MRAERSLSGQIFHLAWPGLIGQVAVVANSVIDTVMAGRLSPVDLAAVGIGASIYASIFITVMGVLLALTPVIAHHYGAARYSEIGEDVRQCVWLALLLALIAIVLVKHPAPFLALADLTPDVSAKVESYLDAVAWSVPGSLMFRVFYGFSNGIGKPRPVMLINLAGMLMKIPLNVIFMYGYLGMPALGGVGCGVSSAMIAWTMAISAGLWCYRDSTYTVFGIFSRFEWPHWQALRRILSIGLPIGGTLLIDVTAFTFMALFIARFGSIIAASHQIAANITVLVFMVPMALGNATGVIVGQSLGAADAVKAQRAGKVGIVMGAGIGCLLAATLYLVAVPLSSAYTSDSQVASAAAQLILLVAIYHVADSIQAVLAQVLRGYKRTAITMGIYVVSLWGIGLGGGYLLGITDLLGPARAAAGFWIAAAVSMAVAALASFYQFRKISRNAIALQNRHLGNLD